MRMYVKIYSFVNLDLMRLSIVSNLELLSFSVSSPAGIHPGIENLSGTVA